MDSGFPTAWGWALYEYTSARLLPPHLLCCRTDLGDVDDAVQLVSRWREVRVSLDNNPWVMPPEAVAEEGLEAVQTFLVDAQKASEAGPAVQRRRLLKVVLVGAASAGKTRCGTLCPCDVVQ